MDADALACHPDDDCPLSRALRVVEGKWSTLIIRELLDGPKRFGELRKALDIGSAKTLTERLRILEHHGVLTRTVHAEVPPRVVYALTPQGEAFRSVMDAMWAWGAESLQCGRTELPVGTAVTAV